MNEDRLFKISVRLHDKRHALWIDPSEEQNLRTAADLVNAKIAEYQVDYLGGERSLQDIIAMVAFRFAYANLKIKELYDLDNFTPLLEEMDQELENYLQERLK